MNLASPNHGERRDGALPSLIVLHYTAMPTVAEARARLCDPLAEVSAHWLISEAGEVEPLVAEDRRAWHAGAGAWAGITDVNSHSIGIELANRGDHPFAAAQMAALETLLAGIMARWSIPPHRVIAHSDMAPARKADPGPRFDWHRLARQGLSVWPEGTGPLPRPSEDDFLIAAHAFGYPIPDATITFADLLHAFRLRFRPWASGALEGTDVALAQNLAKRFPVDLRRTGA